LVAAVLIRMTWCGELQSWYSRYIPPHL
jgi:hypothetical protein